MYLVVKKVKSKKIRDGWSIWTPGISLTALPIQIAQYLCIFHALY